MSDDEAALLAVMELRYPAWTLLETSRPAQFPEGITWCNLPDLGQTALLFPDSDGARRTAADLGMPSLNPLALENPQQVIDALEHCQRHGATYVGFDVRFVPAPGGGGFVFEGGLYATIGEFIATMRKHSGDHWSSRN
jgi:hypothetical protein